MTHPILQLAPRLELKLMIQVLIKSEREEEKKSNQDFILRGWLPMGLAYTHQKGYLIRRHISILDLMPKAGISLGSVYKLPCLATVGKRHW